MFVESVDNQTNCTKADIIESNTTTHNSTAPINSVNRNFKLSKEVVKGDGLHTSVFAIPKYRSKRAEKSKRVWRVLLDSGSDGDLLFRHPDNHEYIPAKERFKPQWWRTLNGTFATTKVGDLELYFPDFSGSKFVKIKPDIVDMPSETSKPVYDVIIGIKTMARLGIVLDFEEKAITIDRIKLEMRPLKNLGDSKAINNLYREHIEPNSMREATNRVLEILDANYQKANLAEIVNDYSNHLSVPERHKLLELLTEFEELFNGTLGDFKTDPISFELKEGAKAFHGRPFPIPHIHLETLKREVERLVELGVLKPQPNLEWGSPTFIIPKKNKQVRFISDFREVNKKIVRKPFPIPKSSSTLQEMEGFTYATALDLNMGYYTIRLDPDAQKICTIVLPWGKYSYLRLPMGIAGSPDFFQEKMSSLMQTLSYIKVYLDDLLVITKSTYDDHIEKLKVVLSRLRNTHICLNTAKSSFAQGEIEYLGYILMREGIKPQPEKYRLF